MDRDKFADIVTQISVIIILTVVVVITLLEAIGWFLFLFIPL